MSYMRSVVVKLEIVIQNRKGRMVESDDVLQSSGFSVVLVC